MPPKKGDDILLLMEKKFDELKGQFINEMNKQIQKIVEVELNKLSVVYEKRTAALESELNSLQEQINNLEEQNKGFIERENSLNEKLESSMDDVEQYSRRQSLRVFGIPREDNETAEDVVVKVHDIIKEINCDVSINLIDRAHRVGKNREDILVKFCSFRDRTRVYKARKSCQESEDYKDVRFALDLTVKRYTLLRDARNFTEHNGKVKFVYPDINCNLRLHPTVGAEKAFNSMDELNKIVDEL